jgi:hypothetical protein
MQEFEEKPVGKSQLRRSMLRCENNIEMVLKIG